MKNNVNAELKYLESSSLVRVATIRMHINDINLKVEQLRNTFILMGGRWDDDGNLMMPFYLPENQQEMLPVSDWIKKRKTAASVGIRHEIIE